MAASHEYRAQLTWRRGAEGIAAGNHRVEWPGRPGVDLSAAPQYKGDPTRTNPEELFVAALESCQMLSYLALAGRAGITVVAYEDDAVGTLAMVDRKMRMASVVLRPRITVAAGSDLAKARTLVETAHENCFIASSVACPVSVEPEIVTAG